MPFLSLSLYNFRNFEQLTIDLSAPEVFLVGQNGQGKTNVLESLYLASYGNSFRTRSETELCNKHADEYSIRVLFKETEEKTHRISLISKNKKKTIEKNLKKVYDRKDLISTIPCILLCHDDLHFATGAPERRRFFIDQSLSLYDSSYIDTLRQFTKLLKSRNLVLKERRTEVLDVLDAQLIPFGLEIMKRRAETVQAFNEIFSSLYEQISGIDSVFIDYSPSWKHSEFNEVLRDLIEKRPVDFAMNTSMLGPHRDKIRFIRHKRPFVQTASTGQQRLLSLILRAAQAHCYTKITGRLPVLLMDDVLLELDPEKRKKFTELLPKYDQLIATFLPGEPYSAYKTEKTMTYIVSEGTFSAE